MKVARTIFFTIFSTLKQEKLRGDFFKQTGKHPPQLRCFVLLLLSLVILQAGCASPPTVRLPNIQEEESIQLKEKAIVLLRFKADMDGKPLDYGRNGFMLALANMDEAQYLKIVAPVISPSSTAREKGWMYLVLKPGTYYLSVRPPGRKQIPPERKQKPLTVVFLSRYDRYEFKPIPPFLFHVPAGSPVVYVGSLSVSCMDRQKKFNSYISEYSEITVTNESDSAKKITRASFSQYGTMSTSLMKQYGKPVTPFTVGELVPMGIKITPLDLMKHDKSSATGVDVTNMGRPPSIIKSIAKGTLKVAGVMCFEFINLYGVFYGGASFFPGEATFRLMDAGFFEGEEKSRQESLSIQELQKSLKPTDYLDPTVTLLHTLKEMLPKYGVHQTVELASKNDLSAQASIHKLKTVLQAEILRVRLRLCETSSYCVELLIRIKLLDISTNKYLYDGILLYTSPFGGDKNFRRSFVIPMFESSDCRNIEDYYGKEGLKVIEEEIAEALKLSIEKVCNDLGLYEQPIVEHTYSQTQPVNLRSNYKDLSASQVCSIPHISIFGNKGGFKGYCTIKHNYKEKTINGDKVVLDYSTGLMWQQSGSLSFMNWQSAKKWVCELNREGHAGFNDWRLPTVDEAASLLEYGKRNGNLYIAPYFDRKQQWIWTGDNRGADKAWLVMFVSKSVCFAYDHYNYYVRPVRSIK